MSAAPVIRYLELTDDWKRISRYNRGLSRVLRYLNLLDTILLWILHFSTTGVAGEQLQREVTISRSFRSVSRTPKSGLHDHCSGLVLSSD